VAEETTAGSIWSSSLTGRYELGALVGCGSMAEVYRAEDLHLRREVAVKLFQPDPGPRTWQRFGEEVRVLAQLSHPGLVSIYDAGMDGVRPFLVTQLVPGGSLSHRLHAGPLAPAAVVRLGTALAEALDHVHGRGIVHRDIKPSNILLGTEGEPYLADFGIAHLAGAVRLTRSGEVVGTAAYLAPEQLTGGALSPAIDVYGLGLVLLECLTGELAFPGVSQAESALARLHRRPRVPDTVPSGLAALLDTMTDPDPARRPAADQVAGALRELDTTSPAYATPVVAPPDLATARTPYPLLITDPGTVRPGPTATAVAPPAAFGAPRRIPFVRSRTRVIAATAGFAVAVAVGLALILGAPGTNVRQPPVRAIPPDPSVPATSVTAGPAVPSNVAALSTPTAVPPAPPAAGPPAGGPPAAGRPAGHGPKPGKPKGPGGGKPRK
jgi:eukaryotic-like serine/threonine-protein kinase